jgi:hypothetical protein
VEQDALGVSSGDPITNKLGLSIEKGAPLSPVVRTYGPGELVPNLALRAPTNLTIMPESITTDRTAYLSDLLQPNMGQSHWAACMQLGW